MTLLETMILALLALWLLATVVYQLFTRRLKTVTRRWDVFRLLPNYRLFTGYPRDFRLFYQDRQADGTLTGWREIAVARRFRWHHAIFHPTAAVIGTRALLVGDLGLRLAARPTSSDPHTPIQGALYKAVKRLVLAYAPSAADALPGAARQFKIEEHAGHLATRSPIVIHQSPFIELC